MTKGTKKYFTERLVEWHRNENQRSLPWKEEKDPYRIWLSEVILQQTRAAQGLPYYIRFTEAYPGIKDMAAAVDEDVFRIWQGLGYYNRCRNMLATARYVADERKGKFPDTYEDLIALKGVGPYTAAAIASFAYGLPHAVVDGNVYRVLARYFGIDTPFDTTEGKKEFVDLATELLDTSDSAGYNQAIMDLGATVCTPALPKCTECPIEKKCVARQQGLIDVLPVRSKKQTVKKRHFHYMLFLWEDSMWIRQRTAKDIWQGLHEPYMIEAPAAMDTKELLATNELKQLKLTKDDIAYEGHLTQRLTHQLIESRFFVAKLKKKIDLATTDGEWLPVEQLKKIAFPKTLVSFLEKKLYF